MEFLDFPLKETLLRAIEERGFTEPTEIQEKAIPLLCEKDVDFVGQAQTGTGKTAAFALPLLNRINPSDRGVQAIILSPTRELANQICEEMRKFCIHEKIRVFSVYGGVPIDKQIGQLKKLKPQVIVGTPGRVKDLIYRKSLKIEGAKYAVLDEADEMTSDAQTALRRIIEDTAKICRFILVANNLSKIIGPIQSRCVVFKFTKISNKEILPQLKLISKKEKIKADDKGLNTICDYTDGDLRHSINVLQAAASSGSVTESTVKSVVGLTKTKDVQDILKLALNGKISDSRNKMIELIKVYGMSESDFLKYITQAVFSSKTNNLEEILEIIAKYDYRILVGANPEIQLSALLAELAKIGK